MATVLDGVLVNRCASLEAWCVAGAVNGSAVYRAFLVVVGLVARPVLALSNVNGTVVRAVAAVDLNARLAVGGLGSAVFFAVRVLLPDAGTAVFFLFTSDAEYFFFFFGATLSALRKMCLGLERRRVLTFPSGVVGELDLNLFVDGGLGGGLGLPVC